jgi:hypothetical protein
MYDYIHMKDPGLIFPQEKATEDLKDVCLRNGLNSATASLLAQALVTAVQTVRAGHTLWEDEG